MSRGISFDVPPTRITYKAHAGLVAADVGKAVTLVADSTVGLGSDGDPLQGKLVVLEAGYCTVETGPYVSVPYTGTAPTLKSKVVVDGAGNVKDYAIDTIANAMKGRGEVVSLDTTNKIATVRTGV